MKISNMKLLLLLPMLVQAKISIGINASSTSTDASIKTSGHSKTLITESDQITFNITQKQLFQAIYNLTGRMPTNVFVKGPTPWNDLYKTYKWRPINVVVKPHTAEVIDIETSNVILSKRTIGNNGDVMTFEVITLTGRVKNTVNSFWIAEHNFTADLDYTINLDGLGNFTKFQLNSTWGEEFNEREVVPVTKTSVEVALKPKTSGEVVLTVTKVKMIVKVNYLAILDGHVVTNNEKKLMGHHFYAYDVATVMRSLNMSGIIEASQMIVVEFYTDEKITLQ